MIEPPPPLAKPPGKWRPGWVIGLIVVSGVLFGVYALLRESGKRSERVILGRQELAAIQEVERTLYGNSDYGPVGKDWVPELIETKRVPDLIKGDKLQHPWDGPITVIGGSDATFIVSYIGLPKDACIKMAANNASASGSGLVRIVIDGQKMALPITPETAIRHCTDNSTIAWTFQ